MAYVTCPQCKCPKTCKTFADCFIAAKAKLAKASKRTGGRW